MFRKLSLFACAAFLSSCAYTTEGSVHDLTIRTPGAQNAVCNVYVDKLRYQFFPPETRAIFRSKKDLVIDCLAPGGRRQKVVIEPQISQAANWNFMSGVAPGMMWDYASESMFVYPNTVDVDFTNAQIVPPALPAHNSPDVRQPETYDLEEFNPSTPRLNSDKYRQEIVPKRRDPYGGFYNESNVETTGSGLYESGGGTIPPTSNDYHGTGGKGDLMDVIQRTTGGAVTDGGEPEGGAYTVIGEPPQGGIVIDSGSGSFDGNSVTAGESSVMNDSVAGDDAGDAPLSDGGGNAELPMPMLITPDSFGPSEAQ